MLFQMLFGAKLKCRYCGQKSSPKREIGNWEALGKYESFVIMKCKKCGYGLKMGLFSKELVSKNFIDEMEKAKDEYLSSFGE